MLPLHPLAAAMQADREREIREHAPRPRGLPRDRHPRLPETGLVHEGHAHPHVGERLVRGQRVAFGNGA